MKAELRILLILFVGYSMFLLGFIFFTEYNGLYGQDSHEYLRYCKDVYLYFKGGKFPDQIFWTVGYPVAGSLLAFVTGPQLAMQLIAILSAAWIFVLLAAYLMNEFPGREKEVAIYTFLFLGLSPYFFRYSISIMSDVPALALMITSFYFADRYVKRKNPNFLVVAAFMFSATLCTRVALLPLALPVLIFILIETVRNFKIKNAGGTLFFVLLPLITQIYFKGNGTLHMFQHDNVAHWSLMNFIERNFTTLDGTVHFAFPNVIYIFLGLFHPGILFPSIIFIFLIFYNKNQPSFLLKPFTGGILIYLVFLCGLPIQNNRYFIAVLPFLLVICFPSYLTILSWFHYRRKAFYVSFVLVFLLQCGLLYRAFVPFLRLNQLEREIVFKTLEYHPKTIYTFGIYGAFQSYGFEGKLVNLFENRKDEIENGSLLVFNKKESEIQWENRNPMINFEFIINSGNAKLIATGPKGWEIYEINEKYRPLNSRVSGEQ